MDMDIGVVRLTQNGLTAYKMPDVKLTQNGLENDGMFC